MPVRTHRIVFVVLFCAFAARAQADPILYNLSGHIREAGTGTFWDLSGSFVLSDPRVTSNLYGDEPTCGCLTDLIVYSLSDLTLQSSVFSATGGTGTFWLKSNPVYATDRYFFLNIAGMDSEREINFVGFNGQPDPNLYQQPDSVQFAHFVPFNLGSTAPRYELSLSAQRVPEPSGLALVILGGLGLAGRRLRQRRARLATKVSAPSVFSAQ